MHVGCCRDGGKGIPFEESERDREEARNRKRGIRRSHSLLNNVG